MQEVRHRELEPVPRPVAVAHAEVDVGPSVAGGVLEGPYDPREVLGMVDLAVGVAQDLLGADAHDAVHRRAHVEHGALGVADHEQVNGVLDERAVSPLVLADAARDARQVLGRTGPRTGQVSCCEFPQHCHRNAPPGSGRGTLRSPCVRSVWSLCAAVSPLLDTFSTNQPSGRYRPGRLGGPNLSKLDKMSNPQPRALWPASLAFRSCSSGPKSSA